MVTEQNIAKWRSSWKPKDGSGKTRFNRMKKPGQSWTKLRDEERKKSQKAA